MLATQRARFLIFYVERELTGRAMGFISFVERIGQVGGPSLRSLSSMVASSIVPTRLAFFSLSMSCFAMSFFTTAARSCAGIVIPVSITSPPTTCAEFLASNAWNSLYISWYSPLQNSTAGDYEKYFRVHRQRSHKRQERKKYIRSVGVEGLGYLGGASVECGLTGEFTDVSLEGGLIAPFTQDLREILRALRQNSSEKKKCRLQAARTDTIL